MKTFRIITGRAGTGKSSYCIEKMAEYIKNRKCDIGNSPAYLIVPEQFAVNAEKRLMSDAELPGLMIDEVLSFKRAACRVLGRMGGLKYELLSPSGKIMLLTQVIRNLEEELLFYGGYASKPRGMEALLSLIDEFGRYGAVSEKLNEIAEDDKTDNLLKVKLSDLSKIYAEYRKLTAGKFYDSETLYTDFIKELPNDDMFKNAHVWIDGFNGFTTQEFEIISVMADVCDEINITLCADLNDKNLFDNPNGAYKKLVELAERKGIKPEHTVMCGNGEVPPRFKNNKYLAHLEKNYGKYPYNILAGEDTGIKILECQNRYYEAEEVAAQIKKLTASGYNYKDIVVVAGSTDQYKNILSAVFLSHKIPYFIDEKRKISSHPLIRYIVGLMELISSDWKYVSVFEFLKTGLYEKNMQVVDILENEVLRKGIKGRSGKKGWTAFVENCKEKIAEASVKGDTYKLTVKAYLLAVKLFNDVELFRENIKKCRSVSDCCAELTNFLIKNEVYEKVSEIATDLRREGRLDSADEYSGIWNIVLDVLNQADVFLGDKVIRGVNKKSQYVADVLSNGFARYRAGFIPHSDDCVQIGTPERSKSLNPKALMLVGANEGVFPSTIKDNGLLNDNDRDVLLKNGVELSDDNKKRALYAEFVMYTVMTTPSEKMFITYAVASSSGDALRPSSAVRKILKLFPDIKVEIGGKSFFKQHSYNRKNKGNYFEIDGNISPEVSEKMLGFGADKIIMSVSRLDTYNGCPYSYLLDYGFRLEPRRELKIESFDTGNLQHGLIEHALKEVGKKDKSFSLLTYEECSDFIDKVFDDVLAGDAFSKTDVFSASERNSYMATRIKDIAKKELRNLVSQLSVNALKPIAFEASYGSTDKCILPGVEVVCSDGKTVSVEGKIDRIDAASVKTDGMDINEDAPVYFRVIDYKSSAHSVTVGDIVNGNSLQLILYVAAVSNGLGDMPEYKGKRVIPAAAFYYAFEPAGIALEHRCSGDVDEEEKTNYMSGLFLAKEDALQTLHGGVYGITSRSMGTKSAIPEGGFEKLVAEAKRNISETVDSMREGKFPAKPIYKSDACKYCDYKSVCRVNSSDPNNVRYPKPVSEDEFWGRDPATQKSKKTKKS